MQKFKFVIFGSIAALVVIGGLSSVIVQAAPPESKIYGCVTGVNGNITQVKMTPHTCPGKSTPIEWSVGNSEPAQGPKGDTGLQGPAGAQGLRGEKGEPGYSYEEALASVDDPSAKVQAVSFGQGECLGPGFKSFWNVWDSYCAKTYRDLTSFSVLSVQGDAPQDTREIWIAPVECPNTWGEFVPLMTSRNVKGYLFENVLPFKATSNSQNACVFMHMSQNDPTYSGVHQVVYSTN